MGTVSLKPQRYQCDTCHRSTLVDSNPYGIDILRRCSLTSQCKGSLFSVLVDTTNIDIADDTTTNADGWTARQVFKQHTQTVKSRTWVIKHGISSQPTVYVYESNSSSSSSLTWTRLTEFTHVIVADGESEITFSEPRAGIAHITSLASRVVPQTAAAVTTTVQPISTLSSEITIATLSDTDRIGITLTFFDTGAATSTPIEYISIPVGPSAESAWFGASTALINGRRYYLRSFNLVTSPLAQGYFTSGLIVDGNGAFVSGINGHLPQRGECMILLSDSPHQVVDRVTTSVMDASDISTTEQYAFIKEKTLMIGRPLIKTTYPPITIV